MGQIPMGSQLGGLSLFSNKFKRGYGDAVFGSDENGIWLGKAEFVGAPFRVDMNGNLVATVATITGMGQNSVSTLVWTATDEDTATWSAGSIKTSDGTVYSIAGGNTGNIAALTYVYLDPATSITVLQKTTTAANAAGNGKILIAVVQEGAAGAKCIIDVVGSSGTTIDGDKVITGKIQSKDGNTFFDLDGNLIQIQDEDSTTVIDAKGLVSATSFPQSGVTSDNLNQNITTAEPNWTDITGATFTFSLDRSALVLVMAKVTYWIERDTGSGDYGGDPLIIIDIDGAVDYSSRIWSRGFYADLVTDHRGIVGSTIATTSSMHRLKILSSGSHTIKLKGTINVVTGDPKLNIYNYHFSYIVFGK